LITPIRPIYVDGPEHIILVWRSHIIPALAAT
jgi:hypothetical protein